jgi:hypothetical protein
MRKHELGTVLKWLTGSLSERLAEISGHPKESLAQTIKDGLACGRLPTKV